MPQNPTTTLGKTIPAAQMKSPGEGLRESPFKQTDAQGGAQTYALGIASVVRVDYEQHEVTLRIENGETFESVPIPMTYPSAGCRHFLGALPLPGDAAVIGWASLESGRTRRPMILGWTIPSVTGGQDWWVTQPFGQDEFALTPKDQSKWEGVQNRVRHKLRHMLPGNIVGSSAQGSDLVLSESVLLANRRGNEIQLRDQDQALVIRTLQQFHAGAGFRIYGGTVQRDATFLPSAMFSDGVAWDAPKQLDEEGNPLDENSLGAASTARGSLTPNAVFSAGLDIGANIDPRTFLQKGLFIDAQGRITGDGVADAIYGGKPLYRVSTGDTNAALDPLTDALTEYRIEVSHTSDGTLPVTEQTDGFDADRLPDTVPRLTSPLNDSPAAPFIEFVLGSVVGNDPFSIPGRPLYGVPLRPTVFDGDLRAPGFSTGVGYPMQEHAALLLKVASPFDPSALPSFITLTKDATLRASFAGPGTSYSAEIAFAFGARIGAGRTPGGEGVRVDADGRISLRASRGDNLTNRGVDIASDGGAVRIYGGVSETVGGISQRTTPSSGGESTLPAVTVESGTNVLMRAAREVVLSGNSVAVRDTTSVSVKASSGIDVQAGDAYTQTSNTRTITTLGKSIETYGGPTNGSPANGPVREVQVVATPATGFPGGVADKYHLVFGDREETIDAGNHSTTVLVGNMTYRATTGHWRAEAGPNHIDLGAASGLDVLVAAGPMVFSATAGSASLTASMGVLVQSTGGTAVVKGQSVILSATGGKTGGIVSGADLDPVSGLPLATLGLGSLTQLLSAV